MPHLTYSFKKLKKINKIFVLISNFEIIKKDEFLTYFFNINPTI